MRSMTWEEKLQALQSLAECRLMMRKPFSWYVSQSIEVKSGPCLKTLHGDGKSPREAVLDHWENHTEKLKADEYVVVNAMNERREAVKWDGYRWAKVVEMGICGQR